LPSSSQLKNEERQFQRSVMAVSSERALAPWRTPLSEFANWSAKTQSSIIWPRCRMAGSFAQLVRKSIGIAYSPM